MHISVHQELLALSDAQLCERFDNDILYDCHKLGTRVSRSSAGRMLRLNALYTLPVIARHLEHHKSLDEELRLAWGRLLNWFALDLGAFNSAPEYLIDTPGWIAWAKKITET